MSESAASFGHPAPHRHKVSLASLLFGFWGGPIAWIGQLFFNYGLSSNACYPGRTPLTEIPVGWRWIDPALLAFDVAALLVGAAAAFAAYRAFAITREEMEGDPHHLLEVGEGRSRFLALCGLITAGGFLLIMLFNTLSLLLVPLCAR
jgi:hypothetical protein